MLLVTGLPFPILLENQRHRERNRCRLRKAPAHTYTPPAPLFQPELHHSLIESQEFAVQFLKNQTLKSSHPSAQAHP